MIATDRTRGVFRAPFRLTKVPDTRNDGTKVGGPEQFDLTFDSSADWHQLAWLYGRLAVYERAMHIAAKASAKVFVPEGARSDVLAFSESIASQWEFYARQAWRIGNVGEGGDGRAGALIRAPRDTWGWIGIMLYINEQLLGLVDDRAQGDDRRNLGDSFSGIVMMLEDLRPVVWSAAGLELPEGMVPLRAKGAAAVTPPRARIQAGAKVRVDESEE